MADRKSISIEDQEGGTPIAMQKSPDDNLSGNDRFIQMVSDAHPEIDLDSGNNFNSNHLMKSVTSSTNDGLPTDCYGAVSADLETGEAPSVLVWGLLKQSYPSQETKIVVIPWFCSFDTSNSEAKIQFPITAFRMRPIIPMSDDGTGDDNTKVLEYMDCAGDTYMTFFPVVFRSAGARLIYFDIKVEHTLPAYFRLYAMPCYLTETVGRIEEDIANNLLGSPTVPGPGE